MPFSTSAAATLGSLAGAVAEAGLLAPAILLFGPVAARRATIAWLERRPLHGKRVVVTRARTQASGLASTLRTLGAEVVELPAIRIEPRLASDEVRDAIAEVKAAGLPAGVAGHHPRVFEWAEANLDCDFYMCSYYNPSERARHAAHDPTCQERFHDDDRALMVETIAAGNANRCTLDAEPLVEKMFANTATMGDYKPSMLIDYQCKRELEVESILGEPVRRAAALNVAVPHMAMQYRLASFLDRLNRGLIQ